MNNAQHLIQKIGVNVNFIDGIVRLLLTTMLNIIISVVLIIFIYDRLVLKRLKKIIIFADNIGNNDLTQTLVIRGNDEIGSLGNALNRAVNNIKFLVSGIAVSTKI